VNVFNLTSMESAPVGMNFRVRSTFDHTRLRHGGSHGKGGEDEGDGRDGELHVVFEREVMGSGCCGDNLGLVLSPFYTPKSSARILRSAA
jgi:hypothetical protein